MILNPYTIKWALFVDSNNVMDFGKSIYAANHKSLLEKLNGVKGKFYIITDKQFGLIQNAWNDTELKPNTKLSIHLAVKMKVGRNIAGHSLVPLTKKQLENPIVQ